MSVGGYSAIWEGDSLIVRRVPIFVECERDGFAFDREWIAVAIHKAKQAERDGYLPPLHVRHHDRSSEVRAAGHFRVRGTEAIQFKGKVREAIIADLIITDPATQDAVMNKRMPYRSVEIFDVDEPAIDGLALLDHEAPFLELPMLWVANVAGQREQGCTFYLQARGEPVRIDDSVLGFVRSGNHAAMLFQQGPVEMTTKTEKTVAEQINDEFRKRGMHFEDDGPPKKKDGDSDGPPKKDSDDGENMEEDTDAAAKAIAKAIDDGSISLAGMEMIEAAIVARRGAAEEPEEETAPAGPSPDMAMKKNTGDVRFAALQGELDGMKAKIAERDAADQRREDVTTALQRLEGRPLGADLEGKLVKFHKEHGPKAFAAYVGSLAEAVGILPSDRGGPVDEKTPKAVMKYQALGASAVERAMLFSRQYDELKAKANGNLRQDRARFVQLLMERDGFTLTED